MTSAADAVFVAAFGVACVIAPPIARALGAPLITVYLLLGLLAQVAAGAKVPTFLVPAHDAALACITLAAGSELIISQLRRNAREIGTLSISLTTASLVIVFFAFMGTLGKPAQRMVCAQQTSSRCVACLNAQGHLRCCQRLLPSPPRTPLPLLEARALRRSLSPLSPFSPRRRCPDLRLAASCAIKRRRLASLIRLRKLHLIETAHRLF
jgi:hypothetical protein